MLQHVIVDEPHTQVVADEAIPYVVVHIHCFVNLDQFKQLLTVGLAYYKEHSRPAQLWGWISDARNLSAIRKEVQQWLALDWNAQAYKAGLREMGIVTSTNIMGKMATQYYAEQASMQAQYYQLAVVCYASLEAAKRGVAQRSQQFRIR